MSAHTAYLFGPYRLDMTERRLQFGSTPIALSPKMFDVLCALVGAEGRLLTKDHLLKSVWAGTVVSPPTLTQTIFTLRRALAGRDADTEYIETVNKSGYRFVASVRPESTLKRIALCSGHDAERGGDAEVERELLSAVASKFDPGQVVAAAPESMQLDGSLTRVREVGRATNADAVAVVTLRMHSSQVSVLIALVDPLDGDTLRRRRLTFVRQHGVRFRDVVGEGLARELSTYLAPASQPTPHSRPVADSQAQVQQAVAMGRLFLARRTRDDLRAALRCFEMAIKLEPRSWQGHAGYAETCVKATTYGDAWTPHVRQRCWESAHRAVELEPHAATAQSALAQVLAMALVWDRAEKHYSRALEIDPDDVDALLNYGLFLGMADRSSEGLIHARRAYEVSGHAPLLAATIGCLYLGLHQPDEAAEWCERALESDPASSTAKYVLSFCYALKGDHERSVRVCLEAVELFGANAVIQSALACAYASADQPVKAKGILNELIQRRLSPFRIAGVHAALGETDQALECLERAWRSGDQDLMRLPTDMRLAPLHRHPRFAALLSSVQAAKARRTRTKSMTRGALSVQASGGNVVGAGA